MPLLILPAVASLPIAIPPSVRKYPALSAFAPVPNAILYA